MISNAELFVGWSVLFRIKLLLTREYYLHLQICFEQHILKNHT